MINILIKIFCTYVDYILLSLFSLKLVYLLIHFVNIFLINSKTVFEGLFEGSLRNKIYQGQDH